MKYNKLIFELERKLKSEYDLKVCKVEKSEESSEGNVFIVDLQEEKCVIKVYKDTNKAKTMISLHTYLTTTKQNVPRIIFSKTNESYITLSDQRSIVVYSFMEGQQIAYLQTLCKLNFDLIGSVARGLRNIHLVTEQANIKGLKPIPFGNRNDKLRCSVLHFDLTKHNIFIDKRKNNKVGFIDFDDAKYGPSISDVAITIANLFFSKTSGINIEGVQKFIDAYYGNDLELKRTELPLIKSFAILWIEYTLKSNMFDTSTTESFEVKKKLIEDFLIFDKKSQ